MRRGALAVLFLAELLSPPAQPAERQIPIGEMVEGLPAAVDPTATYTLYVSQAAAKSAAAPVLLIFDPRGQARLAAELFQPAADRFGWILISSHDSRSDGPWEPNQKAIDALWPELGRFRIDRRRMYATGFSGGAIVSWFLAQATNEIAGVISVGGRLPPEIPTKTIHFAHFGAAGWWDFNYDEMHAMDELVARRGRPHRLELFEGPHSWVDVDLASEAVVWMELQAMRASLRARDQDVIEAAWLADTAAARHLEAAGRVPEAGRRWAAIARTFEGLRDIGEAEREAARIRGSKDYRSAAKALERADAAGRRWERDVWPRLTNALAPGGLLSYETLVSSLEVERLERERQGKGPTAVVARRLLDELASQCAFYLHRELVAAKRHREAEVLLRLAVRIRPTNWVTPYNLACLRTTLGDLEGALEALETAVDRGFADLAHLDADADLEPLRRAGSPRWVALRTRLEAGSGGS